MTVDESRAGRPRRHANFQELIVPGHRTGASLMS
jgi:hypothetical protein